MSDEFMKIKELLEKKTGRKAVIKKMVKNNGTSYTGIFVEFESTNTLPVINLDAFYDECKAQKLSIDEITDKIIAVLNENTSESFNTEAFTNFSLAKDRIIMQLINKTRNQEFLSDVPYIDFWDDLVLIFKYNLSAGYENQANITIHKNHMDEWGADVDTLYRLAQKNTPIIMPPLIKGLNLADRKIWGDKACLLTNEYDYNGATAVAYPELLPKLCNQLKEQSIIFVPVSIHEMLIYPASKDIDIWSQMDYLSKRVKQINQMNSNVDALSDFTYAYSGGCML